MLALLITTFLASAQPTALPVLPIETSLVVQADSTELQAYAGTYTFAEGAPISQFVIRLEKGTLIGEADSFGGNKLVKQTKADTFQSTSQYASIITFERDASSKQITGFTMLISGQELKAKRKK